MARVSGLARIPGLASQCQDCGECEEKCPQKLPVRELLKEVSNEFEGTFFNTKIWFFKKFMKIYKWQMLHMQKHEK
jgi:predicted aldo/keto reductase-like oxidoreductase